MPQKEFKPLDVKKLKEIVQQESARMNLRAFSSEGESAFTLALALSAAVKKIFYEKSGMTFSSEPKLEKKLVTQFVRRMRVDAMEKFNATTVFSVIQFAGNQEGLARQDYLISLVIYLEKKFLPEFLRLLQYPYIDSDEESEVKDGCGTLVNLIGGQYKKELALLGYKDLMMAPFESYINSAADGVGIPSGSAEKFELSFDVEDTKRLVVEMIAPSVLPRWKPKEKASLKKILLVDDDPTYIKMVDLFLKSRGYRVVVAHDGRQGLEQLKLSPDLIILDLQMPNMDGYEFVLAMKEMAGVLHPPIIIMTMKEGMEDIIKIDGIKEYLMKPLNPELLLKAIERHL